MSAWDDDLVAELRLARTEGVGPATHLQLLRRFPSAAEALDALPMLADRAGKRGRRAPKIPSVESAVAELEAGLQAGAALVRLRERAYPRLLAEIDPPPPALWILGDPRRLTRRAVAVVGSRNASPNGRALAASLGEALSAAGLVVISGLARGIDRAAHEGALAAEGEEAGGAAAVLAGGVDHIYPPENADLHRVIAARGALVSEMPMGLAPTQAHFRRRNRLISGLALGVVVVEARARSGSLITAAAAAEQGRDLFAAPGHPFDPRAEGGNRLIREGATLIRDADDVLEALAPALQEPPPPFVDPYLREEPEPYDAPVDPEAEEALRYEILDLIGPTPTAVDALVRVTGAPERAVLWALTELEIAGLALREPGGFVVTAPE